jgi:hypothetical protein
MSKPKIKQISKIEEADLDNPDNCLFYIQYDEHLTQIMLTVQSKHPISPEEYMAALAEFVNEASENPQNLFVEEPFHEDDITKH